MTVEHLEAFFRGEGGDLLFSAWKFKDFTQDETNGVLDTRHFHSLTLDTPALDRSSEIQLFIVLTDCCLCPNMTAEAEDAEI